MSVHTGKVVVDKNGPTKAKQERPKKLTEKEIINSNQGKMCQIKSHVSSSTFNREFFLQQQLVRSPLGRRRWLLLALMPQGQENGNHCPHYGKKQCINKNWWFARSC